MKMDQREQLHSEGLPVYRVVDGELVRISGDARDPKRRYSLVSTSDGSYYREFTEEEERIRDEEEARWEADRPKREAEARRQAELSTHFRASLRYEIRLALYVDILGWTAAVKNSGNDPRQTEELGLALNILRQQSAMVEHMQTNIGDSGWPGDPQFTHFSDCILASARANLQGRDWLLSTLWFITSTLLQRGFLLRGGFTIGELYHRDGIVFGPALLRAYDLERQANTPRILLEPALHTVWDQGDRFVQKDGTEIGRSRTWRKAADGSVFYDFLQPFPVIPGHIHSKRVLESIFSPVRETIAERLHAFASDEKIKQKYLWLAEYFNEVTREHPGHEVAEIDVTRAN